MNQRHRKEDGLDLAMFGLGPFIGKYGWVIADYSFKLMSWSLLVGTLEVFYEQPLSRGADHGKGLFVDTVIRVHLENGNTSGPYMSEQMPQTSVSVEGHGDTQ